MSEFNINPTDIGVAILILVSGLLAFSRGFVKELLSVAAWVGAVVVAIYAFPEVQPYTQDLIAIPIAADATAIGSVFIVALIVFSAITHWIAAHVRDSHFSALDRTLGFLFGLVRGALVVCLLWLLVDWATEPEDRPPWLTEAQSLPLIQRGADLILDLVPERFKEQGAEAIDEAGEAAREAVEDSVTNEMDRITSPPPQADTETEGAPEPGSEAQDAPPAPGYDEVDRQQLDDLIQKNE